MQRLPLQESLGLTALAYGNTLLSSSSVCPSGRHWPLPDGPAGGADRRFKLLHPPLHRALHLSARQCAGRSSPLHLGCTQDRVPDSPQQQSGWWVFTNPRLSGQKEEGRGAPGSASPLPGVGGACGQEAGAAADAPGTHTLLCLIWGCLPKVIAKATALYFPTFAFFIRRSEPPPLGPQGSGQ